MKIETSIKPRKDGTVQVGIDGSSYVFQPDESLAMVAEVEDEGHIAFLLARGDDFLPADDADFDRADALVSASEKPIEAPDTDTDDQPDMNAAPIEEPASAVSAHTPARAASTKKSK